MLDKNVRVGLTFDDVVLVPGKSEVLPSEVDTETCVTRDITINIPFLSAAMDTVTESRMAIALAREGGMGVIHRVLAPADQAAEVDKVKKSESGMILDPITISPDQTIRDAHQLMAKYRISGIPVTKEGKLVGCGAVIRDNQFQLATALGLEDDVPGGYFYLLYSALQEAFEHKVRLVRFGTGAYDVKRRLGFHLEDTNHAMVTMAAFNTRSKKK